MKHPGHFGHLAPEATSPVATEQVPRHDVNVQHTHELLPRRPCGMGPALADGQGLALTKPTERLVPGQRGTHSFTHGDQRIFTLAGAPPRGHSGIWGRHRRIHLGPRIGVRT